MSRRTIPAPFQASTDPKHDTTPIANASDHGFNRTPMPLYLFWFGAYGEHACYAWGCHSLEDALEEAAGWLHDNHPGMFVTFSDADYAEAAADIGAPEDWKEDDEWASKVWERTEVDHTSTESGYLASWEWSMCEVTDPAEVEHVLWRSREGADDDGDDFCIRQGAYTMDPDQGPEDCVGVE
jgi:hypothetical protein